MNVEWRRRRDSESPLEYQKRMYRPLISLDALGCFERDATGLVVRWYPHPPIIAKDSPND